MTPLDSPVDRWASRLVRVLSVIVPTDRRAEWTEQWRAELWALANTGTDRWTQRRFALSAGIDAFVETVHGWREGWSLAGSAADVRQSLRRMRREPGASITAIAVVAAGAAAATSLFALFDAALLRTPPGLTRPHELLQIGRDDAEKFDNFSYPNYRDLADRVGATLAIAAYGTGSAVVGGGADAKPVDVQFATANFFDVTGVALRQPTGRWPKDDRGAAAAVLSDAFWRDHRDTIIGNGYTVLVDGVVTPVAGVAPPEFAGVSIGAPPPAMWLPLVSNERATYVNAERGWSWLNLIGRRMPGVSFDEASAAVRTAHSQLAVTYRKTIGDTITLTETLGFRPGDRREAERIFALLMGGACVVLLVAAANLTGLQLSRAMADQSASAIRVSLGASRARLVRAALIDQMLLAAIGGLAAWILAQWMTTAIRQMLPYDIAVAFDPGVRTLAFSLVMPALLCALLALVPSMRALRPDLAHVIHRQARGTTSRGRMSAVLLVAELAMSTALLVGAGLLLRGLSSASHVDPGFDARGVTVISLRRQPNARPSAQVRAAIAAQLNVVSGISAIGMAARLPIAQPQSTRSLFAPGAAYDPDARPVAVVSNSVDRGFFDVLRIAVPAELAWPSAPPAAGVSAPADIEWPFIVTANAVARLWPAATDARVVSNGQVQLRLAAEIADVRTRSLSGAIPPAMFVPIALTDEVPSFVLVRTDRPTRDVAQALRESLGSLASDVIVRDVAPYQPMLVASLSETVVAARLGVPLATVALMLAAIGLYSAMSRRVARRRREIGVRLALGAQPTRIARAELLAALGLSLPAILGGIALIASASPLLSRVTLGITWRDPLVVPLSSAVVLVATLMAAFVPARRASRIDPLTAFRE